MCAQGRRTKEGERGERTTRVKGANEARRAGREQGCGAAQRKNEARGGGDSQERDAQTGKLRELAERVWNGAADLVVVQLPANVRARKENEGGRAR